MITKGIIEEKINQFSYKVRIPIFDKVEGALQSTSKEDLSIAIAVSLKGIYNIYNEGDIVIIAFEDNDLGKPIILGHLYRENLLKDIIELAINAQNLNVKDSANLPLKTTIGDITYNNLYCLKNVKENIQKQFDTLGLPKVDETDNGKTLKVVNGKWEVV